MSFSIRLIRLCATIWVYKLVLFAAAGFAQAADEARLPRVAPHSPADALSTFKIADGFRIELVAAEPLVCSPVAMAFDEWGRLYVVEMRDYSEQDKERLGRVRLLTDEDGDGKFDTSKIFSEHLSWPTAIACYDGGVFVGAAPDFYYCKDTDSDGVADQQELITQGFDRSNVQRLVNSLQWGLDNRIYGATSISETSLEFPDSGREPLRLNSNDFAIEPRARKFSALTGGGQHGMSFNRWGDRFVCSNSDHLQAIVFEDRYLSRNPFQTYPAARRSIAADGPQAPVYRTSPIEAWRIARTKMRLQQRATGPVEFGGHSAGYFTSATGVTIYEGDLWPNEYRGWAFVGDVGSNLIHRKRLERSGVTYEGQRVDDQSEFLSSTDIWFRPVQMANGPDGALYIADMYREVIEHPNSLPPELKQQIDLTSGRDRGRIYRVVPADQSPSPARPLGGAKTEELVAALDHANMWHRNTAARLLYERQDSAAISPLRKLFGESERPETRIHAIYALEGLDALDDNLLLEALHDDHAQVRRHAIRLCEDRTSKSKAIYDKLMAMVADEDLAVRFQLALSLGELSGPDTTKALATLLDNSNDDKDLVGAALSSAAECAGPVLLELIKTPEGLRAKSIKEVVVALVKQIDRQQRDEDLAILTQIIDTASGHSENNVLALVLGALGRPTKDTSSPQHEALRQAQLKATPAVIRAARHEIDDNAANLADRLAAIRVLKLSSFKDEHGRLSSLLAPDQPANVQEEALLVLTDFNETEVATVVLEAWHRFTPQLRRLAVERLSQREPWLTKLLETTGEGLVQVADIDPSYWAAWKKHPSESVRNRVAQVYAQPSSDDRRQVFDDYKIILEQAGDANRGKAVFSAHCASCHRVDSTGVEIGPSLTAMANRGAEALLFNILVPNAEVDVRFVNYAVSTTDGRILTGFIDSENATSVKLRAANNESHDILRVDIDEITSTGLSIMPDGFEKSIDKQQMADLLAYLVKSAESISESSLTQRNN